MVASEKTTHPSECLISGPEEGWVLGPPGSDQHIPTEEKVGDQEGASRPQQGLTWCCSQALHCSGHKDGGDPRGVRERREPSWGQNSLAGGVAPETGREQT